MIELRHIYKSYDKQEVLKNIDITFNPGELCMLLGPSGCGKSTMLKLINRLIEPDEGEIFINSRKSSDLKPEELRRQIGYAIQGVGLFPHMTVRQNIAVVPKLLKWDDRRIEKRVDELMELMGIPESYGSKRPSMLSGGEAQRIGVARALGADPDILLMDEPFGALDPITRSRLQQEFVGLQKKLGKTVIFVTHDISEAVKMADRLILIHDGQILADGKPEGMAKEGGESTKSFFGDQFVYELLDKFTLEILLDKGVVGEYQPKIVLEAQATFRDAMTLMLEEGQDHIGLRTDQGVKVLSFGDLAGHFGGEAIEA